MVVMFIPGRLLIASTAIQEDLLQQLIVLDCPCESVGVSVGCLTQPLQVASQILGWPRSHSDWDDGGKQVAILYAGVIGNTAAIRWLREQLNVPWPKRLIGVLHSAVNLSGPPVKNALRGWSYAALSWAHANGCGWGKWRCQLYDAAWYEDGAEGTEKAAAVLEWAHKQERCPCTCDHAAADD